MSRQKYSNLLNGFGLLSAGILLAGAAVGAHATTLKQTAATIAQAPAAPTVPSVPMAPTLPGTPVPNVPTMPGATMPGDAPAAMPETKMPDKPGQDGQTADVSTIVDIAGSNDSFKTLTAALKAAGLTEALSGKGPFTVFAPTDAAFAALPKGVVEMLLKPENKAKLVKLLSYHVVSGNLLAADLKTSNVKSLQGSDIKVKVGKTGVMVNNAMVVTADVKASNGVIHAIDKVLMPPESRTAKPGATKPHTTKPDAAKTKPAYKTKPAVTTP